jgi:hypothetical protein
MKTHKRLELLLDGLSTFQQYKEYIKMMVNY